MVPDVNLLSLVLSSYYFQCHSYLFLDLVVCVCVYVLMLLFSNSYNRSEFFSQFLVLLKHLKQSLYGRLRTIYGWVLFSLFVFSLLFVGHWVWRGCPQAGRCKEGSGINFPALWKNWHSCECCSWKFSSVCRGFIP